MTEKAQLRSNPELWTIIIFVVASILATLFTYALTDSGYQGSTSTTESASYFIIYILATLGITGIILFLARKNKGRYVRTIFLVVMIYVIFFVSLVISDVVVTALFNYQYLSLYLPFPDEYLTLELLSYLIWLVPPAAFGYLLFSKPNWVVVNITGLILSIGIASIWSLVLGIWFALALLVLMAVYDYISVFKTKHMVTLANVAISEKIPMLFVIPESNDFDMDSISIEHREGNKALLLGFGDIAIPTVLVVSSSVYGIQRSLLFFILPLLGGIAGMTYLMFFMKRRPAPGLPAINSGVIAGFALALLLTAI